MKYLKIPFSEERELDKVPIGYAYFNEYGSCYARRDEITTLLLITHSYEDFTESCIVDEEETKPISEMTVGEVFQTIMRGPESKAEGFMADIDLEEAKAIAEEENGEQRPFLSTDEDVSTGIPMEDDPAFEGEEEGS